MHNQHCGRSGKTPAAIKAIDHIFGGMSRNEQYDRIHQRQDIPKRCVIMAQSFKANAGEGKLAVTGILTLTQDAVLQLYGGTLEHVGSITVSIPRPSLLDSSRTSVTSSVINLPSHREELVGRPAAEMLAVALERPVVCVAGIYVDDATDDELKQLTENSGAVVRLLIKKHQQL